MGMKNLQTICEELMVRGYDKDTPVAIIEWATHPQQRSIDGKLENIVGLVEQHQMKADRVIVVIGDVVAFREELNYHENCLCSVEAFWCKKLLMPSFRNY